MDSVFQRLESAIDLARLCVNHNKSREQLIAIDRVRSDRKHFKGTMSFLQCLVFASQGGIDLAENNKGFSVFRSFSHGRSHSFASSIKRGRSLGMVTQSTGNDGLLPFARREDKGYREI